MDLIPTPNELLMRLAEILQEWPLYRHYTYSGVPEVLTPPSRLTLPCSICLKQQLWDAQYPNWNRKNGFTSETYKCRNCGKAYVNYYFYWKADGDHALFFKVGQYPAQVKEPPSEVAQQLSPLDLDFYQKALTCRNFSYGLAALAYLRRVIENRMNDVLELLAEVARDQGFAADQVDRVEEIKKSRRFDDKITYAAAIIPPNLRPGGQNPIDMLHDIASEGIHSRSEDDCIEIFDRSRAVFEYVFRQLKIRKEEGRAFLQSLNELAKKKGRT